MTPYYEHAGITILPRRLQRDFADACRWGHRVLTRPSVCRANGRAYPSEMNGTGSAGPTRHYGSVIAEDDKPFDPSFMLLTGREFVIWGTNHFPQNLVEGTVLVWLKRYDAGFMLRSL